MKKTMFLLSLIVLITAGCSKKIECTLEDKTEGKESTTTVSIYYKDDIVNDILVKIEYSSEDAAKEMCDFYKNNSKAINNKSVKCSKNKIKFKEYSNSVSKENAISYYESLNYSCEK